MVVYVSFLLGAEVYNLNPISLCLGRAALHWSHSRPAWRVFILLRWRNAHTQPCGQIRPVIELRIKRERAKDMKPNPVPHGTTTELSEQPSS